MIIKAQWIIVVTILITQLHGGGCSVSHYGQPSVAEGPTESYVAQENLFSLTIPQGWLKEESGFPYDDPNVKTIGLKLIGPYGEYGVKTEIALLYYQHGGFFNNYQKYLAMKENSMVRLDDSKTVFSKTMVDGKKGIGFKIRNYILVIKSGWTPPPFKEGVIYEIVPPSIQVKMVEQFIVVPAEEGFFVFHYKTTEESADKCQDVFLRMIASLHFNNQKPWQGEK